MGRPINKKFIGDKEGALKVSYYRRVGENEQAGGEDTYIVRQRTNIKFTIADTSDGWEENLILVDKESGDLNEGEFIIEAYDKRGNPARVTKFYNRSVKLTGNEQEQWGSPINDESPEIVNGIENIDLTNQAPVITTIGKHRLENDDVVRFSGVSGITGLNDTNQAITVEDDTTFHLNDTDSTDLSGSYTSSEGVVTRSQKMSTFSDIELTLGQPVKIITRNTHSFITDDLVSISDVSGTTEINDNDYIVTSTGQNSFTLNDTNFNGLNFGEYTAGGSASTSVTEISISSISLNENNPVEITTSTNHGFATGNEVTFFDMPTTTELEGRTFTITYVDNNSFTLDGTNSTNFSEYSTRYGTATRPEELADIVFVDLEDSSGEIVCHTLNSNTFRDNHRIEFTGIRGTTELNNLTWTADRQSSRVFRLDGTNAFSGFTDFQHSGFAISAENNREMRIVYINLNGSDPIQIYTYYPHGLTTGDYIQIQAVQDFDDLNENIYKVTVESTTSFSLDDSDSSSVNDEYIGNGIIYSGAGVGIENIQTLHHLETPLRITTSNNHPFQTGDIIFINELITQHQAQTINNQAFTITRVDSTNFRLDGTTPSDTSQRTSGGFLIAVNYESHIKEVFLKDDYYIIDTVFDISSSFDNLYFTKSSINLLSGGWSVNHPSTFRLAINDDDQQLTTSQVSDFNSEYMPPEDRAILYNTYGEVTDIGRSNSNVRIEYTGEDFSTGDVVKFFDVNDTTELNGNEYTVTQAAANIIILNDTSSLTTTNYLPRQVHELGSGITVDTITLTDNTDIRIETTVGHNLSTGDRVLLTDVGIFDGRDEKGRGFYDVTVINGTTLTLDDSSNIGEYNYRKYGRARSLFGQTYFGQVSDVTHLSGFPVVITTVNSNSLTTGTYVTFREINGSTELNGNNYVVTIISDTQFSLQGTNNLSVSTFQSGGDRICEEPLFDTNIISVTYGSNQYTFTTEEDGYLNNGRAIRFSNFIEGGPISTVLGDHINNAGNQINVQNERGVAPTNRDSLRQFRINRNLLNIPENLPLRNQSGTLYRILDNHTYIVDNINTPNGNDDVEVELFVSDSNLANGDFVGFENIDSSDPGNYKFNNYRFEITRTGNNTITLDNTNSDEFEIFTKNRNIIVKTPEKNYLVDSNINRGDTIVTDPNNDIPVSFTTLENHNFSNMDHVIFDELIQDNPDNSSIAELGTYYNRSIRLLSVANDRSLTLDTTSDIEANIDDNGININVTDDTYFYPSRGLATREERSRDITDITNIGRNIPVWVYTTPVLHGFEVNDLISIDDVGGTVELNGNEYNISIISQSQIQLNGTIGNNFSEYNPIGMVSRPVIEVFVDDIELDGDDVKIITSEPHSFSTGNMLTFSGIEGTTELNGNTYTITVVDATSFTLNSTNPSNFTAYQTSGTALVPGVVIDIKDIELISNNPVRITTQDNHTLQNGQSITITNVGGTTELNDNTYTVIVIDSNTFKLNGTKSNEFSEYMGRGMIVKSDDSVRSGVAALDFQDS